MVDRATLQRPRPLRVLRTVRPRGLTAGEARIGLERAWQDVTLVADWLAQTHPVAAIGCRLSVRMAYSALLTIDRVVARLE